MNRRFYNFGGYRLDTHNQRLLCGGETITLTLKEFELLFALVGNAGDVVSKDALLDAVWKDVSVAEETLTRNISWLRKKLGETGGNANYIETVPKRGYRFTLPVTTSDTPEIIVEEQTRTHIRVEETLSLSEPPAVAGGLNLPSRNLISNDSLAHIQPPATAGGSDKKWLALGIVALVTVGFAVYQIYFRQTVSKVSVAVRVTPFSGAMGRENAPAFSPDGKQMAFSWDGGEGGNPNIYVRLLGAVEPLKLTDSGFVEHYPTFSPDGSHIAFVRDLKTHGEVNLIPTLGGAERRVARLFSGNYSISFAPDGQSIAVIDTADSTDGKQHAVYLINIQTGERRRLTSEAEFVGETTPRFAPDGKNLAFVHVSADNLQDLFVASTTGGEPRQVTFDRKTIHSLAWSADGAEIFFVSLRGSNQPNVWRVPASGGEPELIATGTTKTSRILPFHATGKPLPSSKTRLIWTSGERRKTKPRKISRKKSFSPRPTTNSARICRRTAHA